MFLFCVLSTYDVYKKIYCLVYLTYNTTTELHDCEEGEIPLEELKQECDDELCDDDNEVEKNNVVVDENHDQIGLIIISSASKKETSF